MCLENGNIGDVFVSMYYMVHLCLHFVQALNLLEFEMNLKGGV